MDSTDQIAHLLRASGAARSALLQALRHLATRRTPSGSVHFPDAFDTLSDAEIHQLVRRALAAPYPLASPPVEPGRRLDYLLALRSPDRLRAILLDPSSYADPELVDALLGRARRQPSSAPHHAQELAQLALLAASVLPRPFHRYRHSALVDGLIARGNSRRLADHLDAARDDFAQARRLLRVSGQRRQALDLETHSASLALDRSDHKGALQHLDEAGRLLPAEPDRTRRAVLVIQRARVAWALGRLRAANRLLLRAEELAPEDPHVLMGVHHNRGLLLIDMDERREADRIYRWTAHLYRGCRGPLPEFLRLSQAGRVARGRGDLLEARDHFREGQDLARSLEQPLDVAVLDIETAAVALDEGRSSEVDRLVRRAVPVLSSLALPARLSMALLRLRDAPAEHLPAALRGLHTYPFPRQAPPATSLARVSSNGGEQEHVA